MTVVIITWLLYRTESQYEQRHPVTAVLVRNTVKETPVVR